MPGLDPAPVTDWLSQHVGAVGPLEFLLVGAGQSNLTYRVAETGGRVWALRRPPVGPLLPTAHDMSREWRIVTALGPTSVPVARTVGLCEDTTVTGAPFYVMDFVPGVVLDSDAAAAALDAEARERFCGDLVDTLVAIHAVSPADAGLGRPRSEAYVPRQLRRWVAQLGAGGDPRTRADLVAVHDLLAARVPPERWAGLTHGDYRPGNVLARPDGSIAAVLDWELCTSGDVLADVGWLAAWWGASGSFGWGPAELPGFADVDTLARRYAAGSARDVSDLGFFAAFALWRLGCISHGVHERYRSGGLTHPPEPLAALARRPRELAALAAAALADTT